MEEESLIEDDERCVGPWPGLMVLFSVATAGNIYPHIYVWDGEEKGEMKHWGIYPSPRAGRFKYRHNTA